MSVSSNNIPGVALQLLGIAMALAAFLPALAYSYSKGLLEDLDIYRNKITNYLCLKKRVESFIRAVDFILTQSIIIVIFSGLSGVIIFWGTSHTIPKLFTVLLLVLTYVAYSIVTTWSYTQIRTLIIEKKFEEKWPKIKKYRNVWLGVIIFHILSCLVLTILYAFCEPSTLHVYLNILIGLTIWWLIFAATVWIFPIVHYSPLMIFMEAEFIKKETTK